MMLWLGRYVINSDCHGLTMQAIQGKNRHQCRLEFNTEKLRAYIIHVRRLICVFFEMRRISPGDIQFPLWALGNTNYEDCCEM